MLGSTTSPSTSDVGELEARLWVNNLGELYRTVCGTKRVKHCERCSRNSFRGTAGLARSSGAEDGKGLGTTAKALSPLDIWILRLS